MEIWILKNVIGFPLGLDGTGILEFLGSQIYTGIRESKRELLQHSNFRHHSLFWKPVNCRCRMNFNIILNVVFWFIKKKKTINAKH